MKARNRLLLALWIVGVLGAAPAFAGLRQAREQVRQGRHREALVSYGRLRLTKSPELAAEYAHALALAGFKDLALGHLDQALALQENNPAASGVVHFFAGKVFERLGQTDVAQELAAQGVRPAWFRESAPPAPPSAADEGKTDFQTDLLMANSLLVQRRYYTAVDRFQKLAAARPEEPRVYAGYAIALEKVGAYRKAARAVGRSLDLEGAALSEEKRKTFQAHRQELETRRQGPPSSLPPAQKANLALKGRYLAFLGGNVNRTSRNTVSNVNGRLGKFFTNRFDASLTAGYTGGNIPKKYRGGSAGLAGRYHQPLPVPAPLNGTFGARVDYQPRPSRKTSLVVSPGLSWVQENGSFDLFYEYGVAGRLKKTSTVSLGYTAYFGGSR